jgi:hypothetical protein
MIYDVQSIRTFIRTELNEAGTTRITDAEILASINDGQMYVATRSLCIEKDALCSTMTGRNTIKHSVIRINYIEYIGIDSYAYFTDDVFVASDVTWYATAGTTEIELGLQKIMPTNIGHTPLKDTTPQKWFNWGKYVILEGVPDKIYALRLYYSDYPATLTGDTEVLEVPREFQDTVVDFALHALCIKLKRWAEVGTYYNKCTSGIQKAKAEYIKRVPDSRAAREIPESVEEVKNEADHT